jgi:Leucine-rich repeat (LRR) protein
MTDHHFAGSIPPEIGRLGNLEVLDLKNCLLTGSIPVQVALMTNLEILQLSFNNLNGAVTSLFGTENKVSNWNIVSFCIISLFTLSL